MDEPQDSFAIEIDKLSKRFGKTIAFNEVSLKVNYAEIFGLLGPDGAGKTSLIRVLLDVYESSGGGKRLLGQSNYNSVREHIGYVPQYFSLYPDLTVWENISLFGQLYGASKEEIKILGERALEFTHLAPFRNRLSGKLSGGMKQKLSLAAGLLHKPKILFMDEPPTGVDPVSRREFWQMLYSLREQGMTVFVSTSYMDEAELCTSAGFLLNGKLLAVDSPAKLKLRYPYTVLKLKCGANALARKLLENIEGVRNVNVVGEYLRVAVDDAVTATSTIEALLASNNINIVLLSNTVVTMEDVFVYYATENPS